MNPPPRERIRIRFDKYGRVRFTSHRDVARMWERGLRRSRVPVAYSEGFSPRPRLRFGLALATAHESDGEYLDVDLKPRAGSEAQGLDLEDLGPGLSSTLPPGMSVQAITHVAPGTPSLQEAVEACTWLVEVPGMDTAAADRAIDRVMAAAELPVTRTRKGKEVTDDIRPNLVSLRVADPDERPPAADWQPAGVLLRADLGTQPRACRPAELLAAIDPTLEEGRVIRLHQWTIVGGTWREPVPLEHASRTGRLGAPSGLPSTTARAEVRAS